MLQSACRVPGPPTHIQVCYICLVRHNTNAKNSCELYRFFVVDMKEEARFLTGVVANMKVTNICSVGSSVSMLEKLFPFLIRVAE